MDTLIIGYGNVTRRDDGAGVWIARQLDELNLPGVRVRTSQQLHLEFLDECRDADRVVLIDASINGPSMQLQELPEGSPAAPAATSHHLDARNWKELAWSLYGKRLEVFLCSVRAEDLGFGEGLSDAVQVRAQRALEEILALLQGVACHA